MPTPIGHIGLGSIGMPVAVNLIRAGFPAIGHRRTHEAMAPLVEAGGTAADSVGEVYAAAEIIVQCLPGPTALRAVVEEALPSVRPGTIVVELSTYPLADKQAAAERIAERGGVLIDAAVSGTPGMAAARKAALYVGTEPVVFERVRPVLDAISSHVVHTGPFGSATRMKLIANHLLAVHAMAAAEALALASAAGLDPHEVIRVVGGGAGSSRMFEIRGPWIADRRFEPAPGPINTLRPYLHLIGELARESGSATPLLDTATAWYLAAVESGRGHKDLAAMVEVIENPPHTVRS
mgnify:CR=1 FL=1